MDSLRRERVQSLHRSPVFAYIAATGAGGGIGGELLSISGASRTVCASFEPYAQDQSRSFVGEDPVWWRPGARGAFYSPEFAQQLAGASYFHAEATAWKRLQEAPDSEPLLPVGLGMAAAIGTDRRRKGSDQISMAIRVGDFAGRRKPTTYKVVLNLRGISDLSFDEGMEESDKLAQVRERHVALADLAGLNLLFWVAGIEQIPLDAEVIQSGDIRQVEGGAILAPEEAFNTQAEVINQVMMPDGTFEDLSTLSGDKLVVMPVTAFPLTHAHVSFLREAERFYNGRRGVFWLNLSHAHKAALTKAEMCERLRQFVGVRPVVVTDNAPLFIDKARVLPGAAFVTGVDTLVKLLDPVYYGGTAEGLHEVLQEFEFLGTRFHVAGRRIDGRFVKPTDVSVPNGYERMFLPLSEWEVDVSSTAMRELAARVVSK